VNRSAFAILICFKNRDDRELVGIQGCTNMSLWADPFLRPMHTFLSKPPLEYFMTPFGRFGICTFYRIWLPLCISEEQIESLNKKAINSNSMFMNTVLDNIRKK
jgi:hypothetical protein